VTVGAKRHESDKVEASPSGSRPTAVLPAGAALATMNAKPVLTISRTETSGCVFGFAERPL
jgi:hypothetical protein